MCNKVTAYQAYSNIMNMPLLELKDYVAIRAFWPAESYKQILSDLHTSILPEEEFKQSCAYEEVTRTFSELEAKRAEQAYVHSLMPFTGMEIPIEHEVSLADLIPKISPEITPSQALELVQSFQVKIQHVVVFNPNSLFQLGCSDFHIEINNLIKTDIRLVKQN